MNILKLVASILAVLAIGFAGSFFTAQSVQTWYAGVEKPFFTPPNWLFGPAWTLLYFLIGIVLYIAWENGFWNDSRVKATFFTQLGLNFLWSILFFGLQNPLAGLVDIIALDIAVILTIVYIYHHSKASLLLLPYLGWILFASALNFAIYLLNA
ncbi:MULTISPECIES: TspO/MBR family protein [Archaeoglobus]|jgi:tryptophan-rich sensory protein|uniref:Tryptophan-rich protein TspO n=2 Tax=Archaeoglobus fulgidus TaxID=2234 RepID=TSPO_ARCFU|nr:MULTISPECIES: TspO/MBR family protein [Archaeoglobus]O28797.1 RecName: Full=Tryptophan-rich protein TspO; AltName: Full=Translocator protein TspO [Archaeoglobus fulgidus DSM 4304]AAB89774.1 mitochondrial benzodiazepine receptor/sensory transduction protein [Archaeoglobus fulgidus DSM 4304]AIG98486.1 Tryptophan-rich sensory protein [Archaeoglobus fulgidus DSM 8774]MDI3496686.1 translocator protein [Archaeoglobus sp.]